MQFNLKVISKIAIIVIEHELLTPKILCFFDREICNF
jgi:hypothetical protein